MNDAVAATAFDALGHPTRVAILRLLVRAGEAGLNVSAMRAHLDQPGSTFAHHLKALADAGLITQTRAGRDLVSRADYHAIRTLNTFLMTDCCKGVF